MADLTDFFPEVFLEIPDVPTPVALNAVRNTLVDFCERSRYWKHTLDAVNSVSGTATYTPTPPTGAVIADIRWVKYDGKRLDPKTEGQLENERSAVWETLTGTPDTYVQTSARSVTLVPIPQDDDKAILVRAVLKPSATAATVDDVIYDEFHEAVAWGTVARLYASQGKPWSNPGMAQGFYAAYEDAVLSAQRKADSAYTTKTRRSVAYGGL